MVHVVLYMVAHPGRYWRGKPLQELTDDYRSNPEAGLGERKRDVETEGRDMSDCGKNI